jgi:hypothetical protein
MTKGTISQDTLAEEPSSSHALSPNDPAHTPLSQFYALRMMSARSPEERTALARKRWARRWSSTGRRAIVRRTRMRERGVKGGPGGGRDDRRAALRPTS